MKDLIQAHKKLIKTVKEQMGFSDYGMYWLAFLEGGLTIWLLDRIFFHWLKFYFLFRSKKISAGFISIYFSKSFEKL